jgi:mono/diheme cytochrome c family protein
MGIHNKMKFIKYLFLIGMLLFLFNACYYDKKDQVYPQVVVAACDTANVSYSVTVTNILNANCNSCHGASANTLGAGIFLNTYASVKPYITSGRLVNSILQNGAASPMPKNMAKMDVCSINKIIIWVNKGAINN